jgi:hypothetical protein
LTAVVVVVVVVVGIQQYELQNEIELDPMLSFVLL